VAVLVALGLAALWSTHAALSGGSVEWSGSASGKSAGLGPITGAERAQVRVRGDYGQVLWASRPGGEVIFGFALHNGGIVPVTLLSLRLGLPPGVIHDLAPVSALLGPDRFGRLARFHPVALGPGASVAVGLTERVVCDPVVRRDATSHRAGAAWLGDETSPVVVYYRVLGLPASQTLTLTAPLLVVMPYRACG
jgi:hypothetical protein